MRTFVLNQPGSIMVIPSIYLYKEKFKVLLFAPQLDCYCKKRTYRRYLRIFHHISQHAYFRFEPTRLYNGITANLFILGKI